MESFYRMLRNWRTLSTEQQNQRMLDLCRCKNAENAAELTKMLKHIYCAYDKACDESEKMLYCEMSALFYSMFPHGNGIAFAEACLRMCNQVVDDGYVAEAIFIHYDRLCRGGITAVPDVPFPKPTKRVHGRLSDISRNAYILDVSEKNNICCFRGGGGKLTLRIDVDVDQPVLADENSFNNEVPLYFTEYGHFVSPVYTLGIVKSILREILSLCGYPYIRIQKQVVFTSERARVLNYDDMTNDGWQNIDLQILQAHKKELNKECQYGMNQKSFSDVLLKAVSATSIVFDKIPGKHNVSPKMIRSTIEENIRFI